MDQRKVLMIIGGDATYHNFEEAREILGNMCKEHNYAVTISDNLDMFLPQNIQPFNLIIVYSIGLTLTREQEQGLLKAIIGNPWEENWRPRGFIGIHGASISFLNSEPYLRMLGGKFLAHPPINEYIFENVNRTHPIMEGISNFVLNDELYTMEIYPPIEILLSVEYNGFHHPLAWVKSYGLGKVFYLALGHGKMQLLDLNIQKMLSNAIEWLRS